MLVAGLASAGTTRVGDFVIHHNALASENLTSEIAQRIGVERSPKNAIVLVNIQRESSSNKVNAVTASVQGSARDLLGNKQKLQFKQIREAGSVDYMAQLPVKHEQTLVFDLTVTPEDGPTKSLQFQQKFYTR